MRYSDLVSGDPAYMFWPGDEPTECFIEEIEGAEALIRRHCGILVVQIATLDIGQSLESGVVAIMLNGISGTLELGNGDWDPSPEDEYVTWLVGHAEPLKAKRVYAAIFRPDDYPVVEEDPPYVIVAERHELEERRKQGVCSYRVISESTYRYADRDRRRVLYPLAPMIRCQHPR